LNLRSSGSINHEELRGYVKISWLQFVRYLYVFLCVCVYVHM